MNKRYTKKEIEEGKRKAKEIYEALERIEQSRKDKLYNLIAELKTMILPLGYQQRSEFTENGILLEITVKTQDNKFGKLLRQQRDKDNV